MPTVNPLARRDCHWNMWSCQVWLKKKQTTYVKPSPLQPNSKGTGILQGGRCWGAESMIQGTAAAEKVMLTSLISAVWEISTNKSCIFYGLSHMKDLHACKLRRVQFLLAGNMKTYIDLRRDALMNVSLLWKPTSQGHPMNSMLT